MKKEEEKSQLRLAMSEPPKKRKKAIGQEGSITKKRMISMTAQKKKSKAALQEGKVRQVDPLSKKLFKSRDVTGSTIKKTSKRKSNTVRKMTPDSSTETPEPASDRQVQSSDQSEKVPIDVISKKLFEQENDTRSGKKKFKRKSHTLTPKSGKETAELESDKRVNSMEQADKIPEDPVSKNLFESEKVIGYTKQKTTKCTNEVLAGSKTGVDSDVKSGRQVSSSEPVKKTPPDILKRGTKRGKKGKTPKMTSTPNLDEHTNGTELDSSLNSTLPMEEGTKGEKKRKHREDDDNVVTFPGTPALKSLTKRQKGALDTPAVTEKTPMPTGSDQWLDSDNMTDDSGGEQNSDTGKKDAKEKLSNQGDKKLTATRKRERSKENAPYMLKCMNIPRGTKAAYLSLFLSEMDLNPQIQIKRLRRGGARSQTKDIRYAIFTCNTKEERDELLDLDEISLPSGSTGKEWTLRIVPQMTHSESRSNRAIRIMNTPEDVSEEDFKKFFAERKVRVKKAIIYRNDKVAIIFLQRPMDVKRALKCKDRTMKGSEMQFVANKGYVNFDKHGKILTEN